MRSEFIIIPATVPYVPLQVTGRSVVYGLQTAFVIDESSSVTPKKLGPI